jgi:hypothetical protein
LTYVLVQKRFEFSLGQMRELAVNAVEAGFCHRRGN